MVWGLGTMKMVEHERLPCFLSLILCYKTSRFLEVSKRKCCYLMKKVEKDKIGVVSRVDSRVVYMLVERSRIP